MVVVVATSRNMMMVMMITVFNMKKRNALMDSAERVMVKVVVNVGV